MLNIDSNNIGDAGAISIAKALKNNTTLSKLYTANNNIGNDGAIELVKALNLTQLSIRNNSIDNDGALEIIDLIKTKQSTIKIIEIYNNKQIDEEHIKTIYRLLLFKPELTPITTQQLDDNIVKTIAFIKKNLKSKKLLKKNINEQTNKKIFDEYVNKLASSYDNFNMLIQNNYINGKAAINKIADSEKYIIDLHGESLNSIFKLPDNINIVFVSPLSYVTYLSFKFIKNKIISQFDEYLENPYCYENLELKSIFSEALIYYGGQYCLDFNISRNQNYDHVSGMHYMSKTDGKYDLQIESYKYNYGFLQKNLSEFLNTEFNINQEKFINTPQKQYTILLTICKETNTIEYDDNILVFYEKCIKLINFKINYEKNNPNNQDNSNTYYQDLNTNYETCETNKSNIVVMNNRINGISQSQFIRHNSVKGDYRSRKNNGIKNSSILLSKGESFNIKDLKVLILNFKDINNILLKTELFSKLYNIINFYIKNIAGKSAYNFVHINEKIQLDIVKFIFESNYLLMFEFLVYCHLKLQNKKDFLNFSINYMNLKDENGKLDDKIDITKFNYRINEEILNFINDNFNKKLTILDLSNIINKNIIDYIIKYELEKNKNVTKLNISHNNIKSLYFLIQEINSLVHLNELDISNNNIDRIEVEKLVNSLVPLPSSFKYNKIKLTILNIGSNNIGDAGAIAIAKVLTYYELTKLDISNNNIDESGAIAIAKALEINSSLTILDISNNNIDESGVKEIAKALQINTTLKELIIVGNNIYDDGVQFIAKALTLNSSLTKLDISYNNIGNAGAKFIEEALKKNTTLKALIIDNNFISDDLLTKIKEALENKSQINNLLENKSQINNLLENKSQINKLSKTENPTILRQKRINELQSRLSSLKK